MSADEAPEPEAEETEPAGESGAMSERTARAVLAGVLLLAMWGIVAVLPETAYVVVGILGTVGWQKGRAWLGTRRDDKGELAKEEPTPDVGEALRRLVGDDNGVLLTRLRDDLKLPDTKAVKCLLDEAGVAWKAVRTSRGNGPGVHKNDIPAALSPVSDAHGDGCCCRSGDNANTDNALEGRPEEGFRVVRIGNDGRIIYDSADTHRHHQTSGH